MKLYDNPLSPFALKVRIALYEKEIDFEKHEIWTHDQRDEFLRVSPRGEVPALRDGDTVVYDSHVICEYLDDRKPSPSLLPDDAAGRARCRALEKLCDTQIDASMLLLATMKIFRPKLAEQHPQSLEQAEALWRRHCANLDRELQGRDYLCGDFSRADVALVPHVAFAAFLGYAAGDDLPNLSKWTARLNERESVLRATQEAMTSFEQSQKVTDPFFDNNRLHWRNDRVEAAIRVGLGPWLLDELAADRAFFSPVP